jgi:hypothetical protein
VLLFQGLTFEGSDEDDSAVVLAFGILICIMVVTALLLTFGTIFIILLRRGGGVVITEEVLSKLSRDMHYELHLINSLSLLEKDGAILVGPWIRRLEKSQYDELMSLIQKEPSTTDSTTSTVVNSLDQVLGVQSTTETGYNEMLAQYMDQHRRTVVGERASLS